MAAGKEALNNLYRKTGENVKTGIGGQGFRS